MIYRNEKEKTVEDSLRSDNNKKLNKQRTKDTEEQKNDLIQRLQKKIPEEERKGQGSI